MWILILMQSLKGTQVFSFRSSFLIYSFKVAVLTFETSNGKPKQLKTILNTNKVSARKRGSGENDRNLMNFGVTTYSRVSHIRNRFTSLRSKPVSYRMR